MISSWPLLGAAMTAMSKLTVNQGATALPAVILIVEHRDVFFASVAAELKSRGFQIKRAASAAEAGQRVRCNMPDLVLASCNLPDESGWLMVSKWCLSKAHLRVWLYQDWAAAFDDHWVEFTNVERILYHGDRVLALTDQVLHQLGYAAFRASETRAHNQRGS